MVTQVSQQTRQTADQEIARLKRELEKAKGQLRVVQARAYPPNDKHPDKWLIRLLAVNERTEFPIKTGVHTGEDGKQYNDYATFKWLEADDEEMVQAGLGNKKSVNLYFNKRAQQPR